MANKKIKHIVAKLLGETTEETLDIYDESALHATDIVDNLTSNDATKVLSAKQGKALNDSLTIQVNETPSYTSGANAYVNSITIIKCGSILFVTANISASQTIAHKGEVFTLSGYGSPKVAGQPTCLLSNDTNIAKIRPYANGAAILFQANGSIPAGNYYMGTAIVFVNP